MTKAQKQFILKKLIPFILREQGRGFCMHNWRDNPIVDHPFHDGIVRKIPSCGTVCCIGGSIELLKRRMDLGFTSAGKLIGLNYRQSWNLFSAEMSWPKKFADKWYTALTPIAKARVAVSLLREVVRTEGKVLD